MANLQLTKPETGDIVAIMHTTMGDIKIKLFADKTPKTFENFTTHAKNGYYNGLIFLNDKIAVLRDEITCPWSHNL